MIITKVYLKKIIKEEIEKELIERQDNIEEINLKGLAAGAALGLTGLAGGTAQAATKAPVVAKAEIPDDIKKAAVGILQGYEDEVVDEFGITKVQASLLGAKDFITTLQKGKDYKGPQLSTEEERVKSSAIDVVKRYKQTDPERFQRLVAKGEKIKFG